MIKTWDEESVDDSEKEAKQSESDEEDEISNNQHQDSSKGDN